MYNASYACMYNNDNTTTNNINNDNNNNTNIYFASAAPAAQVHFGYTLQEWLQDPCCSWLNRTTQTNNNDNHNIKHGQHTTTHTSNETDHTTKRIHAVGSDTRKGTYGVSTHGVTANFMFLDRVTFWVLPLTYVCLPKSARANLFPQSVKIHYFCSSPISVDPICPQPKHAPDAGTPTMCSDS